MSCIAITASGKVCTKRRKANSNLPFCAIHLAREQPSTPPVERTIYELPIFRSVADKSAPGRVTMGKMKNNRTPLLYLKEKDRQGYQQLGYSGLCLAFDNLLAAPPFESFTLTQDIERHVSKVYPRWISREYSQVTYQNFFQVPNDDTGVFFSNVGFRPYLLNWCREALAHCPAFTYLQQYVDCGGDLHILADLQLDSWDPCLLDKVRELYEDPFVFPSQEFALFLCLVLQAEEEFWKRL